MSCIAPHVCTSSTSKRPGSPCIDMLRIHPVPRGPAPHRAPTRRPTKAEERQRQFLISIERSQVHATYILHAHMVQSCSSSDRDVAPFSLRIRITIMSTSSRPDLVLALLPDGTSAIDRRTAYMHRSHRSRGQCQSSSPHSSHHATQPVVSASCSRSAQTHGAAGVIDDTLYLLKPHPHRPDPHVRLVSPRSPLDECRSLPVDWYSLCRRRDRHRHSSPPPPPSEASGSARTHSHRAAPRTEKVFVSQNLESGCRID